jgi:tRNA (guanine37-N1)-methyltransferase
LLDYPHYTRPAEYRGWKVPEVLIGGNHAEVAKWRREKASEKTRKHRPDLLGQNG